MSFDDHRYTEELARRIEAHWQAYWRDQRTFYAEVRADRAKRYVLDMFIGPSGALHVGHPLGYVATDAYGRYSRMGGYNVLHAFGYDAFGLPAEQYAIRTGQHPRVTTEQNIATIRDQLQRLGLAHDPRRGVATTDVAFYRWTQWIFLRIFNAWYDEYADRARPIEELLDEFASGTRTTPDGRRWAELTEGERRRLIDAHRLAYVADQPVNWCPGLGTVLANEEITADGRSERGNFPVFRRTLPQWTLRITAYAGRLDRDLDLVDWPEPITTQQRRWIPGMRDWLFSRQRYWGEPFPIVYDEHGPVALPETMLPVELPEMSDYTPTTYDAFDAESTPRTPLDRLTDWATATLDLGDGRGPREYRRETNTMPQWAGSCWYELRYLDPANDKAFCDPRAERYWMGPRDEDDGGGVDLYVGGPEHAVLHLLYARFWHKVLYDLGYVSSREPFRTLITNGYVQAYSYRDARGVVVPAAEVEERDGAFFHAYRPVTRSLGKIGKSLGNMVTPDEMCKRYGADAFRVHMLAAGPLTASRPWETNGIVGAQRFLGRVWRAIVDEGTGSTRVVDEPASEDTRRLLHRTIDAVGHDLETLSAHTAVARLMELTRHVAGLTRTPREVAEPLALLLAPLAPHLAEELWSRLGHEASLAYEPFPEADLAYVGAETVVCVVQIDGRLRARIDVPAQIDEDTLRELALSMEKVRASLDGRTVRRTVVRPPRLVNLVTR